jgi:hypothetical protein
MVKLKSLGAKSQGQSDLNLNLKEFVMNEKSELEMEVVELGDAKEMTMGIPALINPEDNEVLPERF